MDVTAELERALSAAPDEPPHRDLGGLLDNAHGALRRRRLRLGAVAAALVLVVGVGAAAALSPEPDASRSIATDPTPSPSESVSTPGSPGPPYARYDAGTLALDEGVEVLDQVDNPLGYALPDASVALRLDVQGQERWELATWDGDNDTSFGVHVSPREVEQRTFDGWVEVQQLIYGDADWLVVSKPGPGGRVLVPREGATIVEQRGDLYIDDEFTPKGWLAHVAVADDASGERYFVLVRTSEQTEETHYFPVRANQIDADTIDEFLTYVRERLELRQFP